MHQERQAQFFELSRFTVKKARSIQCIIKNVEFADDVFALQKNLFIFSIAKISKKNIQSDKSR